MRPEQKLMQRRYDAFTLMRILSDTLNKALFY